MSCKEQSLQEFLSSPQLISVIVGFALSQKISSISIAFTNEFVNPFLDLILPLKLEEHYIIIKKGPNYPYASNKEAKGDPECICVGYGSFFNAIVHFFVTSIFLYFVVKTVCRLSRNIAVTKT